MNCGDVTVQSSGRLDLGGGSLLGCRNFTIEPSGELTGSSGTMTMSGFWTNNGIYSVVSIAFSFVDGCGAIRNVFGTSDSDGDGISDGSDGFHDSDGDGVPSFLDRDTYFVPALDTIGKAVLVLVMITAGSYLIRRQRVYG